MKPTYTLAHSLKRLQRDQMLEWKVAKNFPKVVPYKSDFLKIAPKKSPNFVATFVRKIVAKIFQQSLNLVKLFRESKHYSEMNASILFSKL